MKVKNGSGQTVPWNANAIKREAAQTGNTSIVTAECDNGDEVTIAQHTSGCWDISVNENPEDEYTEEQADQAVARFMTLCQRNNAARR